MSNKLVSIVMPVKNTSQFLEECLQSIINQTYSNWELLAVNDYSTDNSFEILESYAQQDNRIKVFHNDKQGIIPALQKAYSKSSGELITRMDSDDVMVLQKLETMVADLEHHGKVNVAIGLVKYFSETEIGDGYQKYEDWLNEMTKRGNNFSEIYKECVIASPCWMVWREDFEKCGAFNSDIYPEDYDLVFRFYEYGLKCIPSNKLLHLWRDYSTRTSRTHEHYAYNAFLEIKVHYFLKLNYDSNRPLVIWGAGKKGKIVAELLLQNNISFQWICDNPKKIGKKIYHQEMLHFSVLDTIENPQSIVSVASPESQIKIKEYLQERDQKLMEDYFLFC